VPVILDDAVAETDVGSGVFGASIYFVPLRVLGNTPVTFLEYFNYETPGGMMEAARTFAPDGAFYTSDSGRFAWHRKPPTNWCVQLMAKTETRLILETPYLAARLTGVRWTPVQHEASWDTASAYFADGGQTTYAGPSYYTPTA
jgi:hypothetical protein